MFKTYFQFVLAQSVDTLASFLKVRDSKKIPDFQTNIRLPF